MRCILHDQIKETNKCLGNEIYMYNFHETLLNRVILWLIEPDPIS